MHLCNRSGTFYTRVCWFLQKVSRENRCSAKIFEIRPIPPSAWYRWLPESNYGMYWTHKITHTAVANWDPISPHLHRQETHIRHMMKNTHSCLHYHMNTHTHHSALNVTIPSCCYISWHDGENTKSFLINSVENPDGQHTLCVVHIELKSTI